MPRSIPSLAGAPRTVNSKVNSKLLTLKDSQRFVFLEGFEYTDSTPPHTGRESVPWATARVPRAAVGGVHGTRCRASPGGRSAALAACRTRMPTDNFPPSPVPPPYSGCLLTTCAVGRTIGRVCRHAETVPRREWHARGLGGQVLEIAGALEPCKSALAGVAVACLQG
jgi:hypothetical protein